MHLADHPAVVTAVGERLREERVMIRQRDTVAPQSVIARILAGDQAGP
jgi:hypothetical protein